MIEVQHPGLVVPCISIIKKVRVGLLLTYSSRAPLIQQPSRPQPALASTGTSSLILLPAGSSCYFESDGSVAHRAVNVLCLGSGQSLKKLSLGHRQVPSCQPSAIHMPSFPEESIFASTWLYMLEDIYMPSGKIGVTSFSIRTLSKNEPLLVMGREPTSKDLTVEPGIAIGAVSVCRDVDRFHVLEVPESPWSGKA
jgi:hypothetical protein